MVPVLRACDLFIKLQHIYNNPLMLQQVELYKNYPLCKNNGM